jgi:ELP3 family radical SAM enzyme/protein acetyltransferase
MELKYEEPSQTETKLNSKSTSKYIYIEERPDIYQRKKNKNKDKYVEDIITPSGGTCCSSRVSTNSAFDIEGLIKPLEERNPKKMEVIVKEMVDQKINNRVLMDKFIRDQRKKHKEMFNNTDLLYYYKKYSLKNKTKYEKKYDFLLQRKTFRSQSGVMVITVFTSPYPEFEKDGKTIKQTFTCQFDCYYCPNEPGQPRSYLLDEPGVRRANANNFDPIKQFWDRANSYRALGHPVDKIELLILGGTWHSYPAEYRNKFITSIFYSANTYYEQTDKNIRQMKSLKEEQNINQSAQCRIIGITIETRPDMINKKHLIELRELGVTRVQLGVQSTDDRVLYRINRRCYNKDTIRAIKLLKDNCFKIDIHIMPDLPQPLKEGVDNKKEVFTIGDIDTSVDMKEVDKKMFKTICFDPDFQIDQIKIYPCETLPWTRLEQDFKTGAYKPYGQQKDRTEITPLHSIIMQFLTDVPEWVRINRIIRDIPDFYILGGNMDTNMRNVLDELCKKNGVFSRDIRNREVKKRDIDPKTAILKVRKYISSLGTEYFLSFETPDEKVLFGFLRLRLCDNSSGKDNHNSIIFPELLNCALIRELHVYGNVLKVGENKESKENGSQHMGFGKKLLEKAFEIATENNYSKIAVISGVGVMNYYRKFGFEQKVDEHFMLKDLTQQLQTYKLNTKWKKIRQNLMFLLFFFLLGVFIWQIMKKI